MVSYIDPIPLEHEQLKLKRPANDDYAVRISDLKVGRIRRQNWAGASEVWTWNLTGPFVPIALHPAHGVVDTLDEAKVGFRAKFQTWWEWAAGLGKDVVWHA